MIRWFTQRSQDARRGLSTPGLDVLASGLDAGIFVCDRDQQIQYANDKAKALFRVENPVGQRLLTVTLSHRVEQLVRQARLSKAPQEDEIEFGETGALSGQVRAWVADDGRRVLVSIIDVTRLRHLERVRQDFVANVSHELRTPLAVIRGMTEVLQQEDSDSDLRARYLVKTLDEVDRLTNLVNDLLSLATAESGTLVTTELDFAQVVREVALKLSQKAEDKGLVLMVESPGPASVCGNAPQLTQVVINVLDNAINYSSSGKIVVRLTAANQGFELLVEDEGIGISSEHLPRIFERFYRADRARSRDTGGTGLGLSIVKHVVEQHEGTVSVESALNKGSKFRIWLPTTADSQKPLD